MMVSLGARVPRMTVKEAAVDRRGVLVVVVVVMVLSRMVSAAGVAQAESLRVRGDRRLVRLVVIVVVRVLQAAAEFVWLLLLVMMMRSVRRLLLSYLHGVMWAANRRTSREDIAGRQLVAAWRSLGRKF